MASPWRPLLVAPAPMDASGLRRDLEGESDADVGSTWEMIYTGFVLLLMFAALLSDRIGADMVMLAALTLCMAANIITVSEGISGFSNEGVLTVLVLFVVAAGIQVTGGLDWYMGKLLGRPNSISSAQARLMLPIMFVSAFLNNTPVVVVMIPIVQKWGKNVGISPAQLLIPLSFASILGGTCTLIGTSTNLVVQGLLLERYPNDPSMSIGLFDLGEFGVPIALIGMTYVLIASPYLLPGSGRRKESALPDDDGTILMGARLTRWSPAAGRSVKRSGLRDTGGIYLVSVYRAATGNVHRAVGQEFVLNVDDILYFTGMVEEFGSFCQEHGLEVVTNEHDVVRQSEQETKMLASAQSLPGEIGGTEAVNFSESNETLPLTIDTNPASPQQKALVSADLEKIQAINRISDMIRGDHSLQPVMEEKSQTYESTSLNGPAKVVVVFDTQDLHDMVIIGVNSHDRPGLLLDISRRLHSMGLQLHHTEAAVVSTRSFSVWRCELLEEHSNLDADEIMSSLKELLNNDGGSEAVKRRGLSVVRAVVTESSRLAGKRLEHVDFRELYKAAIIAVQKADKSEVSHLSQILFASGDVLVLQADDDSPLLVRPPDGFYNQTKGNSHFFRGLTLKRSTNEARTLDESRNGSRRTTNIAIKESVGHDSPSQLDEHPVDVESGAGNLPSNTVTNNSDQHACSTKNNVEGANNEMNDVWLDLRVLFPEKGNSEESLNLSREYLAAMKISPKSQHAKKTVDQAGLDKLTGLFIVQVERPVPVANSRLGLQSPNNGSGVSVGSIGGSLKISTIPVQPDDQLEEGDIIWFAGSANAIADLRKIPGLVSSEDDELKKIDEKVHDRRLVQAVIARKGPLVGKTAAQVGFRTRYGAAVIAVHRDGTRVQDHPGNIKLQAGDVLLLEAGPTFISRNTDNQHSFALISEVKDSKPPRLNKLIPALVLVVAMLAVVTAGISSLLVCGLITCIIMVTFGIISQQECREAVNWEVYVTIACAFGIGTALTNSGLANLLAEGLVSLGEAMGIGVAGLYGSVYLATFLISNIVTNNAAAALMFPIAMEAADQTNADPLLMSYNLMLAASASFMSPFGYTTNLLIYGPGGYTVKDFLYFGTPMQIILWILTTVILSNNSTMWYLSWIWTSAVCCFVMVVLVCPSTIKEKFGRMKGGNYDKEQRHTS
ncbi:hypothetical protein HJC23_009269 [Cyclotella cryptica]|uniref:Uncharacterized protein n=1 Tax=Cyclotella cryptica TaxID=29204 RepID=A0ABD3Q7N0_9STRA|eukprot:CCRYP_008552-RA/>CCRYP_008552-RA protein AED:0.14 eAED:0.14 QI:115/1/1/1/1/1/2/1743/1176